MDTLPVVCSKCADSGWLCWVTRNGVNREYIDPQTSTGAIPPVYLTYEPCDCAQTKVAEKA